MKKILFLSVFLSLVIATNAQNNVDYKVTRDDPNDICNFWMFLDPFQMDFGFKNIYGTSFNTGITGMGFFQKRFGFDYAFRYGTFTFGRLAFGKECKAALQIEAGGMFTLSDKTRTKQKTKVVLSISKSTNSSGQTVETTKFIIIPAQNRVLLHARGGLYFKRNPFSDERTEGGSDIDGNLTNVGVYVGLSRIAVSNVFINTNTDGQASRSGMFRVYADLIVCPVRNLTTFDGGQVSNKDMLNGPIGFRVGFYGMPCEDRNVRKRKAFAGGVEVGVRPGDGLYCTASWMLPLMRRKAAVLGYKRPEGTNDKGQVIEKE